MVNRHRINRYTTGRYRITGPQDWPLWADYQRTRQTKIHGTVQPESPPLEPEPVPESSPQQRPDVTSQPSPSDPPNAPQADSISTPISAAPTPALATGKGETELTITGNTAGKLPGQIPTPHLPLGQLVELWLKREGIPYVSVDEAKKALFAGAKLRSFHFVAYRNQGPHWLIWAGNITPETRPDMLQWEQIFGEGFKAVLARPSRTTPLGFAIKTLADEPINW